MQVGRKAVCFSQANGDQQKQPKSVSMNLFQVYCQKQSNRKPDVSLGPTSLLYQGPGKHKPWMQTEMGSPAKIKNKKW